MADKKFRAFLNGHKGDRTVVSWEIERPGGRVRYAEFRISRDDDSLTLYAPLVEAAAKARKLARHLDAFAAQCDDARTPPEAE